MNHKLCNLPVNESAIFASHQIFKMTIRPLTIQLIIILVFQLSVSAQTDSSTLVGSIWVSEVVPGYCYDSLEFRTEQDAIYYSCEETYHYDSEYNYAADSIQLAILKTYGDEKWPTTIRTLKFEENELKQVRILQQSHHKLFREVDPEVYLQIKNFVKIEN